MKKFKAVIIVALTMLLSSCNNQDIRYIDIPTASTTGSLYTFGNSVANLWNNNIEGIKANVQASNGGIDNLNLLKDKEADVSMAVSSNVYQAYNGLQKFEGRANKDIRIITGLYYNPNQVVVRKDKNINSLEDLKNKRFAPGTGGSTTEEEASIHLENSNLKYPDDIDAQYVSFTEAVDLMKNDQLDGAWIMSAAPTSAVTEMLKTTNTELLEIPEELVLKLSEKYPWYSNYTIKKGTYEELDRDINTSAVKMLMFTSKDMDEELVYEMTKTFWENIDSLKSSNTFLKEITVEDAIKDIADLPLHDGAIRYYREIGIMD